MVRVALLLLILVISVIAGVSADAADPSRIKVRYSISPETVRVVLDLPAAADFADESIPTMAVVSVATPLDEALPPVLLVDAVVDSVLVLPDGAGQALLMIPLLKARKVHVFTVPAAEGKPFRVVVDVLKRFTATERRAVSPAITYIRQETQTDDRYLATHTLEIDTRDPHVHLAAVAAQGDRERVSTMVTRTGAVGGVNGGYFLDGTRPVGLLKTEGQVRSMPIWGRTAAALPVHGTPTIGNPIGRWRLFLADGTVRDFYDWMDATIGPTPLPSAVACGNTIAAVPANPGGLTVVVHGGVVVTRTTGSVSLTRSQMAIRLTGEDAEVLDMPLEVGEMVAFSPLLTPADWLECPAAVGGGPRLLRGGVPAVSGVAERFQRDILFGRNSRTALGVTADDRVLLVAIEGVGPYGGGVTLDDLAGWLKARGVVEAMNLDGGGSTTMAIGAETVNVPAGGWVRPLASGVLVYDDRMPPLVPSAPTAAKSGGST